MKRILLSAAMLFASVFGTVVLTPALAHADTTNSKNQICQGLGNTVTGADCSTTAGGSLNNIIKTILNILSTFVAIVSVFMIVLAGFKYITSGGDSSKITGAKNTIVYALIGLVIVAFAQTIVKFVIDKSLSKPLTHQQILDKSKAKT